MKNAKEELLSAYSILYDIETSLRLLLTSEQPSVRNSQKLSYWQLVTLVLDYNVLQLTTAQKRTLRYTTTIRNKTCHMLPLEREELTSLKRALASITSSPIYIQAATREEQAHYYQA